jgi:peptidoglycan/xylan/chitin deacetylase (PgdA/CDA1 family)
VLALIAIAGATASAEPAAKPKDKQQPITELTDDPVLGKANRVEGEEVKGFVAFTFDDGPDPRTTPAVLDALEKYDVPATFFVISQRLLGKLGEASRGVLARELTEGFTVGNHSFSHPNLKAADAKTLDKEIDLAIRVLAKEMERPVGMFRPPYGALNGAGRMRLKRYGVTEVIWSIDTLDWRAHDAKKLRKKVITMITKQNGGIVLMHDVKPITAQIIGDVLDDLEAENCRRLDAKEEPILPVSIHYFLRNGKDPRPVPDAVRKRTEDYRKKLPERCAKRVPKTAEPTKPATAQKSFGDLGKSDLATKQCYDNPLAKGCR